MYLKFIAKFLILNLQNGETFVDVVHIMAIFPAIISYCWKMV